MFGLLFLVNELCRSWWRGGRFARVIIFVIVWAVLFEALLGARPGGDGDLYSAVIRSSAMLSGTLAWIVSAIPAYRHRRRERQMAYADFYSGFNGP